jgi:hypothetical protein
MPILRLRHRSPIDDPGARRRNDDWCKDEHVDDQLPTNVVAAIARAVELLNGSCLRKAVPTRRSSNLHCNP